jgi:hypothetical protein
LVLGGPRTDDRFCRVIAIGSHVSNHSTGVLVRTSPRG